MERRPIARPEPVEGRARGSTSSPRAWKTVAWLLVTAALRATSCSGKTQATGRKVIVLGFDGMDYQLTTELIAQGRLPNLARLAQSGSFAPLASSIPPQSPVAWSTFITGTDPGQHAIFDFIHRDAKTLEPFLS